MSCTRLVTVPARLQHREAKVESVLFCLAEFGVAISGRANPEAAESAAEWAEGCAGRGSDSHGLCG